MRIVEIKSNFLGGHDNQNTDQEIIIPPGFALLTDKFLSDNDLHNFPFGDLTVKNIDGVPTVIEWIPGKLPESKPPEPQQPTLEDRVDALEIEQAALVKSIGKGLSL